MLHDGRVDITRFGHAALLLEHDGTRVLVDPGVFSTDETFALEGLDAIVVTHQHADHLDPSRAAGLVERNPDALLLSDPDTATLTADLPGEWLVHRDGDERRVGTLTLRGVGSTHAEILPSIARISNVGVTVTTDDGTSLFHPGDTYAYVPDVPVTVLALPLSAPWAKVSETVAFVQQVSPTTIVPIHDCTASDVARGMYWGHVVNHSGVEDARQLGQTDATTVA